MKLILKIIANLTAYYSLAMNAHVLIITHSYNRPDFIEIQYKTFKKFMIDEYEFVVFNDARDENLRNQITNKCAKYQIKCLEIPQEIHDLPYLNREPGSDFNHSASRCANVVQFSLDTIGFNHDGIVAIIDSDMFLINEFSIEKYLNSYELAGHKQIRGDNNEIEYIWNGLVFFNMKTLPNKETLNFDCGWVEGVLTDVGGYTYYYFKKNADVRIRYFEDLIYVKDHWCNKCANANTPTCNHNTVKLKEHGFNQALIDLVEHSPNSIMELFLNKAFLHYRAGGNWNNESAEYHQRKTLLLNAFIHDILNEE